MSLWMFQVGLNVTVDETWVDVTSRHRQAGLLFPQEQGQIGSEPEDFLQETLRKESEKL
jgi:hypothetical protein